MTTLSCLTMLFCAWNLYWQCLIWKAPSGSSRAESRICLPSYQCLPVRTLPFSNWTGLLNWTDLGPYAQQHSWVVLVVEQQPHRTFCTASRTPAQMTWWTQHWVLNTEHPCKIHWQSKMAANHVCRHVCLWICTCDACIQHLSITVWTLEQQMIARLGSIALDAV